VAGRKEVAPAVIGAVNGLAENLLIINWKRWLNITQMVVNIGIPLDLLLQVFSTMMIARQHTFFSLLPRVIERQDLNRTLPFSMTIVI